LAVTEGGTGASTLTDHGVLVGSGASAITALTVGTNGQVLIGSTGADPVFANVTSTGGTITISEGAGTLNLESNAGVLWEEITDASKTMVVGEGYIENRGTAVTFTLPSSAAVGDVMRVTGIGAGGWKIAQNAGQTIYFGTSSTTTGAGGYLESTEVRDSVELVCVATDTDFNVISSVGNITVA